MLPALHHPPQRLSGLRHRPHRGKILPVDRIIKHEYSQEKDRQQEGAWRGKAGAYGVQDEADAYVEAMEGSFSNVVGLPLEMLTERLGCVGKRASIRARKLPLP